MGPSLPRILDVQEHGLLHLSFLQLREVKPPPVHLHDFVPKKSTGLFTVKPFQLPTKYYRFPHKKQIIRISFHPQRVRRATQKQMERGILPTLLVTKRTYAQVALSSCEFRELRYRKRNIVKVETPRPFCMFSSRVEQIEFSIKSLLQKTVQTTLPVQSLQPRILASFQSPEGLSGLQKLGFAGAFPSPRKEDCFRDFLSVRRFPDDEKRQTMLEKQANEYNPRMTFTR